MHAIRLRSPWEPHAAGFRRHFNRPTGLASGERVWLVIDDAGATRVALNGAELAAVPLPCPARFEITALLRPRNELLIAIAAEPTGVRLELGLGVECDGGLP